MGRDELARLVAELRLDIRSAETASMGSGGGVSPPVPRSGRQEGWDIGVWEYRAAEYVFGYELHPVFLADEWVVARVSAALGMTVYAHTASPRKTPESRHDVGYIVPGTGDEYGTIPVSWHHGGDRESIRSFLALGLDHLVVSLPLTSDTTHLLGADEFAILSKNCPSSRCKPYVTNISRGKVLDQDALLAALNSGELGGAAIDVTDPEPLPSHHPLWDAPNLQISPHVSSLGSEYFPRAMDILKLNLERVGRGEPLVNELKRTRGY